MLDKIRESSKYLAPFVKGEHTIGIILGTGLGELGKSIEIEHAIPYMAIPNFPRFHSTRTSGRIAYRVLRG